MNIGTFQNFSVKNLDAFLQFVQNWEIFIGYIDSSFAFMLKFYECFLTFYTNPSKLLPEDRKKPQENLRLFWREYVGIEPTREVTSPPQRF